MQDFERREQNAGAFETWSERLQDLVDGVLIDANHRDVDHMAETDLYVPGVDNGRVRDYEGLHRLTEGLKVWGGAV